MVSRDAVDNDGGWAKLICKVVITSLHVTESILRRLFFTNDIIPKRKTKPFCGNIEDV